MHINYMTMQFCLGDFVRGGGVREEDKTFSEKEVLH